MYLYIMHINIISLYAFPCYTMISLSKLIAWSGEHLYNSMNEPLIKVFHQIQISCSHLTITTQKFFDLYYFRFCGRYSCYYRCKILVIKPQTHLIIRIKNRLQRQIRISSLFSIYTAVVNTCSSNRWIISEYYSD